MNNQWDLHFMREAKLWAERSTCLSKHIGAILVKDNSILAAGYNGPSDAVPCCDYRDSIGNYLPEVDDKTIENTCPRKRMGLNSGEGMRYCVAVHAEIHPILQAARRGIPTDGATLYAYCGLPCVNCMKEIIQAGIKRIVCIKLYDNAINDYNFPLSEQLCKMANIKLDVIPEEEFSE